MGAAGSGPQYPRRYDSARAHTRAAGRPRALDVDQIGRGVIELGFERFTVRSLATHLGVGEKTLYRYASGRDDLVAIGLEVLMLSRLVPFVDPGTEVASWREILIRTVDDAWAFLSAHPGAATAMARGVHARPEVERTAAVGRALMARGFSPDAAIETLSLVFELVIAQCVTAQRKKSPSSGSAPIPEAVIRRMGIDPADEIHSALRRAMELDPKAWLDRWMAMILDGVETRYLGG